MATSRFIVLLLIAIFAVYVPPSAAARSRYGNAVSIGRAYDSVSCDFCLFMVSEFAGAIDNPLGCDAIQLAAIATCILEHVDCNPVDCPTFCYDVVSEFGPLLCAIEANTTYSPIEVCAYELALCPIPPPSPPPRNGVPVPSNLSDSTGQRVWPSWSTRSGLGTFVHISDLHIDTAYVVGSSSSCGADITDCCQTGVGGNGTTAGEWGDYNCDTPPQLIDSLFAALSAIKPPPDFVIYTGDDPAHNIEEQTQKSNLAVIKLLNAKIQAALPNTPVFSAVGNHEANPVDQFAGPGQEQWLYDGLVNAWMYYLPLDAIRTTRYGSYYQTLVRPGLRVLSLNTNFYATGDWYTCERQYDFSSQLAWMNDTLYHMQLRNERAIIIAHQEPKNFFDQFAVAYNELVRQYRTAIVGLFYGHTHWQSLNVYTDNSTSPATPTHVGYIGGSVTPYTQYGPGFTVYTYNRSLSAPFIVQEMSQYWIDLDDVNRFPTQPPQWTERLVASKQYRLPDLSPASWTQLATAFVHNQSASTYQTYYTALMKGHPGPESSWQSIQSVGCDMLSTTDEQYSLCMAKAVGIKGLTAPKSSCDSKAHRLAAPKQQCPPPQYNGAQVARS